MHYIINLNTLSQYYCTTIPFALVPPPMTRRCSQHKAVFHVLLSSMIRIDEHSNKNDHCHMNCSVRMTSHSRTVTPCRTFTYASLDTINTCVKVHISEIHANRTTNISNNAMINMERENCGQASKSAPPPKLSRLHYTFVVILGPAIQTRRIAKTTKEAKKQTPPYIHIGFQCRSCESVPRIPPPPGPPASTPAPTKAKAIPILVPIFDLSLVKATTITEGSAIKTPEKKPNSKATITIPPTVCVAMRHSTRTPHTIAPGNVSYKMILRVLASYLE